MKFKQTINSFSAWTVDRLTSARRATLTMLATFLIAMTAQTAWAQDPATIGSISYNSTLGAYEIKSVNNLNDLAVYVNGSGTYSTFVGETASHNCKGLTFKMTADIKYDGSPNNFTPIGDNNNTNAKFYGTFDGQGHTISGIRINKPSVDYIGVFGRLGTTTSGVVKNLVVRNCSIEGDDHVGGIAGDLEGGEVNTGIIENCHVGDDVTLKGNLFVGGIAGICRGATIGGCTCAATITGTKPGNIYAHELGGIAGQINSGTSLIDNIFTGTISGELGEYIGAIVGNNANGDLVHLGNNVYTSTGFDGIGAAGNPTPGTNPENKAKFAYLITAGKNVTVDFNGAAPADTQSGPNSISIYDKGMKYANYVVSYSTPVDLLLSYKPGFIVTGYTASTGTLTGTAHTGSNDAYTLSTTEASTITAIVDLWGNLTGDADGTEDHPYILSSPEALDLLAENVNAGTTYESKYFKLGADIEYDPDVENNFTPIGNASNVFGGTFDGDGKTISGLNINLGMTNYVGLFGCTNASSPTTIKGVKLDNSTITGQSYVGGILGGGSSSNTSILNCVVTSAVTVYGSVENVGGIVGKYATVRGCTSAAAVDGYQNVGGIIGNGYSSTVEYCLYTGNSVTARDPSTPKLGAIIGDKDNCSLTANYYTQATIGGSGSDGADVAGARQALTVTFPTNCLPSGTATVYNVSGITGYTGKSGYDVTTVNNIILYNDGTTSTYYSGAGESVIFLYNYDGYQVSVTDADGNVDFTKDIKQTTTNIYYNYTFTMPAKAVTITATDVWGAASGKDGSTADKAYTITGTAGLDLLAQNVNGGSEYKKTYFKLGDDIEYDGTANNFTPIGIDDVKSFYGTFDGQGHTISGININRSGAGADLKGVFGFLYGTVENLVVSNCSIVGSSNVGAIAGELKNGTIENCSVSDDVILSGYGYVGGIVGASNQGTIKGCVSAATITGIQNAGNNAYRLGGIAGATTTSQGPSELTDNLFTGAINGKLGEFIGAIVGQNANGTLTNNVHTSTVLGGIGAASSKTAADGAGAHKAVEISAAEGVTITPTGTKTTYNVSGITAYTDNNFIGYDSKLYAGATQAAKLSITYTEPEGYMFEGFDAGEGVGIVLNEGVYNLAVPASGNVTISPKLKDLTLTLDKIVEFETLAIDENMQSYVENGALKLKVTPKNKFWTLACGVDLLLPEGIVVYKARMNSAGTKVDLTEISDSELNGVLKANNGVLIASTPGESYEFKVSPENSVTTLSTDDAKSYGNDNQLVPVLEETHFDSENYFILTDNQFVMVDVSKDTKVPAGKAVLKVPAGTAQARAFGIDANDTTGDTTGINAALENAGEEVWYNLQGQRISKPTRKGIYILNGKKVRM